MCKKSRVECLGVVEYLLLFLVDGYVLWLVIVVYLGFKSKDMVLVVFVFLGVVRDLMILFVLYLYL